MSIFSNSVSISGPILEHWFSSLSISVESVWVSPVGSAFCISCNASSILPWNIQTESWCVCVCFVSFFIYQLWLMQYKIVNSKFLILLRNLIPLFCIRSGKIYNFLLLFHKVQNCLKNKGKIFQIHKGCFSLFYAEINSTCLIKNLQFINQISSKQLHL